MVVEYRVSRVRDYAPTVVRARGLQIWALMLLIAAILYTFLQYFTFQQTDPTLGIEASEFFAASTEAAKGDLLNRFFWLFMLVGSLPLIWRYQRRLLFLVLENKLLLIVLGFCLLSVTWAVEPEIAFRRFAELTVTTAFAAAVVAALPSPRHFVKATLIASATVIVLDLVILPTIPRLAFDWTGAFEGVHSKKNSAGLFFLLAGVIWFFAASQFRGDARRFLGFAVFALIVVLLILTKSKTSQATLPVALLFAWFLMASSRKGRSWFALAMAFFVFSILAAAFPLGIVSPLLIVDAVYGDITLTGRTIIWNFIAAMIEQNPWQGYGYGSFWGIGDASPNVRYGDDLVFAVGQAHNGYLDIAVQIGMIGLVLSLLLLLIPFLRLFTIARAVDADDMNGTGVAIMVALLIAGLIHNVTESSILRTGHPMWFFMLSAILYISVIQLRIRFRFRDGAS